MGPGEPVWSVSLGSQNVEMTPIGTGSNYTLYAGDISAFRGLTEDLRITASYDERYGLNGFTFVWLDSISFFPVPEPSSLALVALGSLAAGFAWRRRVGGKRHRR